MEKVPIPTDAELHETIEDFKLMLELFEIMLKLNDAGREAILIYMCGLSNFDEFKRLGGDPYAEGNAI